MNKFHITCGRSGNEGVLIDTNSLNKPQSISTALLSSDSIYKSNQIENKNDSLPIYAPKI